MGGIKYYIIGIMLLIAAFMTVEYLKDLLDILLKTIFGFVVITLFLIGLILVFVGLDEDSKYQKRKAIEMKKEGVVGKKMKKQKS